MSYQLDDGSGSACSVSGSLAVAGGQGFYGVSPPASQPAATAQSAVATTAITTLATTPTATDIAVAVNSIISRQSALTTLLNQIRSDLVSLGAIKGSA